MAPTSITKRIGTVAGFITLLVITAVIGLLAWLARQQYLGQRQYEQISTEGQKVTVRADQVDRTSRSWKDQFVNTVYLTFTYQHKPYTLRYQQDTGWLNTGDRVDLFYHPGLDAFRQPRLHSYFKSNLHHSRLIGFAISAQWTDGRKWQVLWIALASVFALLLCSLLARLTGLQAIRTLGRLLFIGLLLTGVVYLTYNTWQYYRYYNQLRSGAREETVQVLSTNSRSVSKRSNWFYTYEATVQQGKQEKLIPIDEAEYKTLKPGAPLQVYYNSQLNDMMSVNHTPGHTNLVATLFAWFLLLFFSWQQWQQLKKRQGATTIH